MGFKLTGGLAALVLLAGAVPAFAQNVEFTLINNSSYALHYIYTTPSESDEWGDNLLGDEGVLESGAQGVVSIGDGSDQCLYDFRFETEEGHTVEAEGVDICTLANYTVSD